MAKESIKIPEGATSLVVDEKTGSVMFLLGEDAIIGKGGSLAEKFDSIGFLNLAKVRRVMELCPDAERIEIFKIRKKSCLAPCSIEDYWIAPINHNE